LSSAEVRYLKINFDEIVAKLRKYARMKAKAHETKAIVLDSRSTWNRASIPQRSS